VHIEIGLPTLPSSLLSDYTTSTGLWSDVLIV